MNVSKHNQINIWWIVVNQDIVFVLDRKSVRQSTTEHTRLTYLRLQERQVAPRRRKGTRHERPLTQAELLAEAKVTAEINLRSLGEELITVTFTNFNVYKTWMNFFFFLQKTMSVWRQTRNDRSIWSVSVWVLSSDITPCSCPWCRTSLLKRKTWMWRGTTGFTSLYECLCAYFSCLLDFLLS